MLRVTVRATLWLDNWIDERVEDRETGDQNNDTISADFVRLGDSDELQPLVELYRNGAEAHAYSFLLRDAKQELRGTRSRSPERPNILVDYFAGARPGS